MYLRALDPEEVRTNEHERAAMEEANESAVHFDLLLNVSEDSVLEVDGEVVQRDGRFWFEEGF